MNKPEPNTTYLVDDQFLSTTDSQGRVISAVGVLVPSPSGPRNFYQQRIAGRGRGRVSTDDGGHLFASQLGGPGEGINLVAMDSTLNRTGQWREMEEQWVALVNEGKQVEVLITPVYSGSSARPDSFIVRWHVVGTNDWVEETIQNVPPP